MLAGGGVIAASLATGVAAARILPADMQPLIGPGYRPVDADERGLWQQYARVEEEIAGSNLLIKDPALTTYLRDLIGKVGGPAARDMRIYLARIPDFNAVMFPTGFTVIFSGLLLRMRNEAQLAGVIAHESGHFLRKHQIRQWRDMRRKTDIFSILAVGAGRRRRRGRNLRWRPCPARPARHDPVIAAIQPRRSRQRPTRWARDCSPRTATRRSRWPIPGSN